MMQIALFFHPLSALYTLQLLELLLILSAAGGGGDFAYEQG